MTKWISALCIAAALSAAAIASVPAQDTTAKNKEFCKRFMDEVINQGKLETVDELLAPNFTEHEEIPPGYPKNHVEAIKQWFKDLRTSFPDLKAETHDVIAEGDLVAIRGTWSGTQKGAFMGVPASNKKATFEVIDIVRVKNGKCTDHWGQMDMHALMIAIGAAK